jgi:hypothetical protein
MGNVHSKPPITKLAALAVSVGFVDLVVYREEYGLHVDSGSCIGLPKIEFETLIASERLNGRIFGNVCTIDPVHGQGSGWFLRSTRGDQKQQSENAHASRQVSCHVPGAREATVHSLKRAGQACECFFEDTGHRYDLSLTSEPPLRWLVIGVLEPATAPDGPSPISREATGWPGKEELVKVVAFHPKSCSLRQMVTTPTGLTNSLIVKL